MESVSRRHICTHLFIATPFTIVKMFAVQLLVVSDSFQPHRLQHIRIPCPSLFPGICTNSCPLSRLCHPTISSSVALFSCPQSFPASGSFPMSRLFASGGWSIGASASVLPMNIQGWFPLGLIGLILLSKARQFKSINSSVFNFLYDPILTPIHDNWKNHSFWLDGPLSAK